MSRSGYSSDCANINLYRGAVASALGGKRGQEFLRELLLAMDAMEVKELIQGDLIDSDGACCTIGVVCASRRLDVRAVDPYEPCEVGRLVGVAWSMAAEIEFMNDEGCSHHVETPAQRWVRMRLWVDGEIRDTPQGIKQ